MQTVAANALADFQAEDPVELSFKADEVLRIHNYPHEEPNAPGWYLAENALGAKGIVPVSYVRRPDVQGPVPADGQGSHARRLCRRG